MATKAVEAELGSRSDGVSVARRFTPVDFLAALTLVGILALALWLRWDRLEYAEFTKDQAWVIDRAYRWLAEGDFPFHGFVASVGAFNGPMEVYLISLPVAFSTDPRLATAFVGLLQTLAILGTYLLSSQHFGRLAGLSAALLYAVNPWALEYARKMWTPDMLPLFTVLYFSAVFAAVVQRRRNQIALACLWLAVLLLIHISSVVYAPLLLLVLLLFWRRIGLKPLLLGAAAGLIVASPFLYFESQRGFDSLGKYLGVGTAAATRIDLDSLKFILTMGSAEYFPTMMGYGLRGQWLLPWLGQQNDLSHGLLWAGLATCLWQLASWLWQRRPPGYQWEKYALLLLWFVVPVATSLRHSMELYPHYFIAAYPVQFVLMGLALATPVSAFARTRLPRRRYLTLGVVALAVAVPVYISASYFAFFRTYLDYVVGNGPTGPYGVPLLFSEQAVDTARVLRARFANDRVYAYSYLQRDSLDYLARPDLQLRQVEPPDTVLIPKGTSAGVLSVLASDDAAAGLAYGLVDDGSSRLGTLRALGFAEVPDTAVRGPDGHLYYRFFRLPPGKSSEISAAFAPPQQQIRLANGLRLLGCKFGPSASPGGKAALELLWELPGPPRDQTREVEYNLFAHLVDGNGRDLGTAEREVSRSLDWRSDELMVSTFEIPVPRDAGPTLAWFDVGAYSRYDRAGVLWQDANGRTTGSNYRVGPVRVAPPVPSQPPSTVTDLRFGDSLALVGYDLDPTAPVAGGNLAVTLRWHAVAKPAADYAISVQLLDASGRLVAQQDSPPVEGKYPTSVWAVGEEVVDRHVLSLPKDIPPGTYRLLTIVYTVNGQQRLVVAGGSDHAQLANLAVGGGR